MIRNRTALCVAIALALSLALPSAAWAGKKNKKKSGKTPVEESVDDHGDGYPTPPKRGIGKGGVPRLRDHLLYTIHRVDELEDAVSELEDDLGDGMEMLTDLIGALQEDVTALEEGLAGLDSRVAALEELATDDDEDGFSENLGDCDDADPAVNPLADEVPDNGIDDDCDFDVDEDEGDVTPEPLPEI